MKKTILRFLGALALITLTTTAMRSQVKAEPIPMDFDKNAVAFIFSKAGTNFSPSGTCFGVDVATTHRGNILMWLLTTTSVVTEHSRYIVTAKHVLFDENGNLRHDLYMRVDTQNGGLMFMPLDLLIPNLMTVLTHTNKSVDIAVIALSRSGFQYVTNATLLKPAQPTPQIQMGAFDSKIIADPKSLKKLNIREGDDMFFVGLFTPLYGSQQNIPICRFGRLSMPTEEQVPLGNGNFENLYLMEAQTFGGNSGSPAFFVFDKGRNGGRPWQKTPEHLWPTHRSVELAGIVKGYFRDWSQIQMVNSSATPESEQNLGVTVIVPAHYLYDILFSDEQKKIRADYFKLSHPTGYN